MTATRLIVNREEYPTLIPDTAAVGERYRVTLTGVVRRIEGELIDTTSIDGPDYSIGESEVELLVIAARPVPW
jgi:hypothetical protein